MLNPVRLLPAAAVLLTATGTGVPSYGLEMVNAADAWTRTRGAGTTIAIVDSGVDLDHPELAARIVVGIDLVDNDDHPDDENGHGTHVAGIAHAAAPEASLLPVRVFDAEGAASNDRIAAGISAAVDRGADVINLSLGDAGVAERLLRGGPINRAIRRADAAGVVVVSAAGNEGQRETVYRDVVSLVVVAAVGPDGQRAPFSNYGDERTVAAPGVEIQSTAPPEPTPTFPNGTNGTATLSGTSMSAPFVSAQAALLLAAGLDADEILARIPATAHPGDETLGAGIVDYAAAFADIPASAPAPAKDAASDPVTTAPDTTSPATTTTVESAGTPDPERAAAATAKSSDSPTRMVAVGAALALVVAGIVAFRVRTGR